MKFPLLLTTILLLACAGNQRQDTQAPLPEIEPEELLLRAKTQRAYIDLLAKLDTGNPDIYQKLSFYYDEFPEDKPLIEKSKTAPELRKRLARAAQVVVILRKFNEFDLRKWKEAREELKKYKEFTNFIMYYIADIMCLRLSDSYYRPYWKIIRLQLADTGEAGYQWAQKMCEEIIKGVRGEYMINFPHKHSLPQFIIVILMYGERGLVYVKQNLLGHPKWQVRAGMASAIGEFRDIGLIELLKPLLEDKNWIVRARAGSALGNLPCKKAREIIKKAIEKEKDPSVIKHLLESIKKINAKNTTPILIKILKEYKDPAVVKTTIDTLCSLYEKRGYTKREWLEWWQERCGR